MIPLSQEYIAKLIAIVYDDWPAFMSRAKKVIKYIRAQENKQKDFFR